MIPTCRPTDWLETLRLALQLPAVEALRRRLRVAGPAAVIAAAQCWADAADFRTGRNVAISHETVAAAIGYAPATVKRICRFLTRLRFLVEVARGRNRLTLEQLAEARRLGAEHQRAAASTRALTIPSTVDGTPLPTPRRVSGSTTVLKSSPKRAGARSSAAARPKLMKKKSRSRAGTSPRSQATMLLAAKLDELPPAWTPGRRVGRLTQGRHIGQLWQVLDSTIDTRRYAWRDEAGRLHVDHRDLLQRIDAWFVEHQGKPARPDGQRDRLAYFRWCLSQAIDPATETRAERWMREQAEARARTRKARLQVQLERERASRIDSPERRTFVTQSDELTRRRRRPEGGPATSAAVTTALLGKGRRPADFSPGIRRLHAHAIAAARLLSGRGWVVDEAAAEHLQELRFTRPGTSSTVRFTPPAAVDETRLWSIDGRSPVELTALLEQLQLLGTHDSEVRR